MQLVSIKIWARCLAKSSCTGLAIGSKLERCIHPTVEELSLQPRQHENCGRWPSIMSSHIVTMADMNSSTLFVCCERSDGGM